MGASVRILSTNLWYGRADADGLRELIERLEPDVVVAQELGSECAEAIADCMPHGVLDPRDDDANGMGVATRLPAEFTTAPMRRRPIRIARLDPADWPQLVAPLEIANVHVTAPHSDADGFPFAARYQQIREIERHLDSEPAKHRVVLGDFNATPLWPVYWRMARRLNDAAVECARREGRRPLRTWGPGSEAPRLLRIDHAFTEGLRAESFRVLDVPGSDHSAILVELAPL